MESAREGRKRRLLVCGLLLLGLALPARAREEAGKHPDDAAGQECAACHAEQEKVWLSGKHGLMGVKCVVCHGAPEKNFAPRPGLAKCRGCHSEQVSDLEKVRAAKDRTCFRCHDNHSVAVTAEAAKQHSGFHRKGGAR